MTSRRSMIAHGVLAGAAVACCWLPLGIAPLLPFALLIAMRGLRLARASREAALFGLVYGITRYGVAAHFLLALTRFSMPIGIAFYLLAIVFILPYAVLESWAAFWMERMLGLPRSLGLGLLWTLLESARTIGDLSFPADLLAHGFGSAPAWLAWSPWIGPFGLTLLAFLCAWLIDLAMESVWAVRAIGLCVASLVLWSAPPVTDRFADPVGHDSGEKVTVGIVQPAIAVLDKLNRDNWPNLWRHLGRLTAEAARGADLVVWPETTRPGPIVWEGDEPFRDPEMQALANRVGVPILYGCEIARVRDDTVIALYNGAALVVPGHEAKADWYGKQRLLPLAEGVPFADLFGWDPVGRWRESGRAPVLSLLGNFKPGPGPTVFEVGPARIGVLICYEGMYPDLGRRYRLQGANLLVVLTNDAWWGRSVFATWHAMMMASQARSLGLPVIRAANTGVSSATDPAGRMIASKGLFEVGTLEVAIGLPESKPTPFARHGYPILSGIVLLIAAALARRLLFGQRARARAAFDHAPSGTRTSPT